VYVLKVNFFFEVKLSHLVLDINYIMSKDDKDQDTEALNTKRASKYRYELCTYCRVRHPPPSGEQCVMALLNASERGEVGIGARRKTPTKPPVIEQQQLIIDDQGAGGGEASAQTEDAEAGECLWLRSVARSMTRFAT
jgi:hypothetical protein